MKLFSTSDNHLDVSEIFYSIQGEGITAGHPSIFLRLAQCNLYCGLSDSEILQIRKENNSQSDISNTRKNKSTWLCDTVSVWLRGKKMTWEDILNVDLEKNNFMNLLLSGVHLVVTGGEPLIQQKNLKTFFAMLLTKLKTRLPFIEVETNGTIEPLDSISVYVSLWNVSPKLSNSGMDEGKRKNKSSIKRLNSMKSIFKFVINDENDWKEIEDEWINDMGISRNRIVLMPSAEDINELNKNSLIVAELCKRERIRFSSRYQISIWNKSTGV